MSRNYSNHSEKGSRHWWLQRVSAIALIPLTLWFMYAVVQHVGDDFDTLRAWIDQPLVTLLLVANIVLMFFHAQLGMQEVIEDYVHGLAMKKTCLLAIKIVLSGAALIAIYSLSKISL